MLWPQHVYYYREEIALMFLAFKSYDIEKALISLMFKIDELIMLIRIETTRVEVSRCAC